MSDYHIEQIMEARQKRAELLHDMVNEAREIVRVRLTPGSPEDDRALFRKLHSALYVLRGDPFDMHMRAALSHILKAKS